MKREKAIVIIPTYNEKGNIGPLIEYLTEKVFGKIKDYEMHVLVVDDSSPDGTEAEVREVMKKRKNVHILVNKKKAGLGNAYTKGMKEAVGKLGAQVVFEFDADFSHDPEKIPEMLALISKGYDLVLGARYMAGGSIPENWGWHRKFLSVFGNLTIRIILGKLDIHDWTTGYRAIRSEVVKTVLPKLDQEKFMGYTFQIGFLHHAVKKGFKIGEVPFHFKDRLLGKSKLGSEYIINTMKYILRVRASELVHNRIAKFMVVGLIGSVVQLASLVLFRYVITSIWGEFSWGEIIKITPYLIAQTLSIEMAIISNFILSNIWTFADRKLELAQIPAKFGQFNLTSAGSMGIQILVAMMGERFIGLRPLTRLKLFSWIDTGLVIAMVGIGLGMFWNYFAYSRIIWRKKKS